MKKILFTVLAIMSYSSIALIGDTPYTIKKNLKQLQCGPLDTYIAGKTKIGVMLTKDGILEHLGSIKNTLKISKCEPMSSNADSKICKIVKNSNELTELWIDASNLLIQDPDAITTMVLDSLKLKEGIAFDACVRELEETYDKDLDPSTSWSFGSKMNQKTKQNPVIINIADMPVLNLK